MSYDTDTIPAESADEKRARTLKAAKDREREDWRQLYRRYSRCVDIATGIWMSRLEIAAAQQQALAEQMRDREVIGQEVRRSEIPVPLFTPRDRWQFIKEVATALNITAERAGLTVRFPKEPVTEPEPAEEAPDADVAALADAGERPIS